MNLREGRIGKQESVCLAAIPMLMAGIFTGGTEIYEGGNSAYVAALLSALLALLIFQIAAKAMARRGNANLTDCLCDAFGPLFGRAVALLYAVALLLAAATPLIRLLLILHRYVFIESGIDNLTLYFAVTLLILTVFGLETIGRTAKMFFGIVAGALLLALLMASPTYEVYRLYPLLGDGIPSMLRNAVIGIDRFLPPLLLLLCCCRGVHGIENAAQAGRIAAIGAGIGCCMTLLCLGMAYSYRELTAVHSPMYRLTMSLAYGSFLRTDKILLFVWTLAGLIGASALAYGGAKQFCEAFRMRDVRPAAASFAAAAAALSLLGHFNAAWLATAGEFFSKYFWLILTAPILAAAVVCLLKKERVVCVQD